MASIELWIQWCNVYGARRPPMSSSVFCNYSRFYLLGTRKGKLHSNTTVSYLSAFFQENSLEVWNQNSNAKMGIEMGLNRHAVTDSKCSRSAAIASQEIYLFCALSNSESFHSHNFLTPSKIFIVRDFWSSVLIVFLFKLRTRTLAFDLYESRSTRAKILAYRKAESWGYSSHLWS